MNTLHMIARLLACVLVGCWFAASQALGDVAVQTPTLTIAGAEEVVISADKMNCRPPGGRRGFDVTDLPASAFRRADGTVVLLAGNRFNFYLQGPDLDHVRRTDCSSLLSSARNGDPSQFRDNEWITSVRSNGGQHLLAFIHNEYHGWEHKNCASKELRARPCWYASVTMAESRDGGRTFTRPPAPNNLLMSLPYRFDPASKRAGVSLPKAVANPIDGNVYVFASYGDRNSGVRVGQCLARGSGKALDDWRLWNGTDFIRYDAGPYGCKGTCTGHLTGCRQVMDDNIFSVRYIPSRRLYIALGVRAKAVIYRFSNDLVTWSTRKVLMSVKPFTQWRPGDPRPIWYFSLLDPSSNSSSFDTLEERPYLYFVKFQVDNNKLVNARRDLIRVRVRIE